MLFESSFVDLCMLLFHDNYGLYYERFRPLNDVSVQFYVIRLLPKKKIIWVCIRDLLDYLVFNFSLFILCFGHKIWLFLESKRHNVNFVHRKYVYILFILWDIQRRIRMIVIHRDLMAPNVPLKSIMYYNIQKDTAYLIISNIS